MGQIILSLPTEYGTMGSVLPSGALWAVLAVALAALVALYLLRSFGIYYLAKNNGIAHAYLAWIPAFWIYPCCKLIGEQLFFGKPYAKIALVIAIVVSVGTALSLVAEFLTWFPLVGYFFSGGTVYVGESEQVLALNPNAKEFWTGSLFVDSNFKSPYNSVYMVIKVIDTMNTFVSLFELIKIVVLINVYIVLFRKFWPRHYIVASVMSFFGLFPIFAFVIRKKTPVKITTYVYTNPYQDNPYGYRGSYPPPRATQDDEPFEEFKSVDDEPFGEIFNKKNGDK